MVLFFCFLNIFYAFFFLKKTSWSVERLMIFPYNQQATHACLKEFIFWCFKRSHRKLCPFRSDDLNYFSNFQVVCTRKIFKHHPNVNNNYSYKNIHMYLAVHSLYSRACVPFISIFYFIYVFLLLKHKK